jgi:replicative DNA helicase
MTTEEVENLIIHTRDSLARVESLALTKGKLFEVTGQNVRTRFKQFYKELKNRMFLPTGYKAFDDMNIGIPRDSLWVIAGKTGCGKSSLALDVLMNMKERGARVCLLPLEMSVEQMLIRMGANLIGVPANEIMRDFKRFYKPMVKAVDDFLHESPDDPSCFHFYVPEEGESLSQALKTCAVQNYDIIAVDYLGLMAPEDGETEQWKSLDKAGRRAKRWATANKTCVCVLAQLDEKSDDIRYAKALKEHASNMWIWKETLYEIMEAGCITVQQPKARNQSPNDFKLRADLRTSKFGDYITEEGDRGFKNANSVKSRKPLAKGFDDVPSDDDI